MRPQILSGSDAAALIDDGMTVLTVGMTLIGASESVLKPLEQRFLESGHPRDLTLFHAAGQSDRERGIQHFAHVGMIKRIIGAHWGLAPKWMELISGDHVEAYCLPQGQITHLLRDMGAGLKGHLSKVGLGTFIDPRLEGGKMNKRTRSLPDLVELVEFQGEPYLYYHQVPIDICLIRGTTADEHGNITFEDEVLKLEVLPAVLATKHFGGKVIVQVKQIAKAGTLHAKQVTIPGALVDYVVISDNPEQDHRQTSSFYYDPAYSGDIREPQSAVKSTPLTIRKLIGRRAAMELKPDVTINLGTGIPNDEIGGIVVEEGLSDDILITVESGVYGGSPLGGIDFGIAKNMEALLEHTFQFDFYNGTGVDFTFMGVGQIDGNGNVNSTKFSGRSTGAGGFIDITQFAKNVIFCTTFTAQGLKVDFDHAGLRVVEEGKSRKFVDEVEQISFNGKMALARGQRVLVVTERAVFKLSTGGWELIEVAPGVDVEREVVGQMDFVPIISSDLSYTSSLIYREGPFGLREFLGGM
ncbi:acyl CoA:acetate/3-ketoacid CoA transferase [Alicyclobacillus fastidiosus]|uniref:Acyl CoA:acetate/3-ketoacid CoA transferase n=1 Tax=Alicyclobacillus fastidiosus TaxID=392011 RepID=A0ABY6ZDH4_9BACL|nr:CoA-transferase [Alicyclobacillus fastidiosus]WAH40567.1 acyl CoA:acetate/3-ketoacid CoA transferase [Alicyclobacillus fastidiosus]GMA62002.1 propionate CoA-transferase [Alicyclobacillus fastidiosus]